MKLSEIVKPSNLADFLRLQFSCISEDMEKVQFLARFDHCQSYLPDKPVIELIAVYELSQNPTVGLSLLVTDQGEAALGLFEQLASGKQIAQALGVAWIELHKGLELHALDVIKPWGKEIWYTGIEQRGVSKVKSSEGLTPLDWVFSAAPEFILGKSSNSEILSTPILLKILDPLPDEVYGDLYFEMHEQKQEVYVVTHVDKQAWPDGKGGIRFGFNQELRRNFSSDKHFKQAYLQAVQDYRRVRLQIDSLLDKKRELEKIGLNAPVMPEKIKQWQETLPSDLLIDEKRLRTEMENFIAIKKLSVGDVVRVPCFTPHSLQHGVRTVEFQTPVYERKILSFAQKVLTQDHWDTVVAVEQLVLDAPQDEQLKLIKKSEKLCREQVVEFSDFQVERITLLKDANFSANKPLLNRKRYQLLLLISGSVGVENIDMQPGEARLLSAEYEFDISCLSDKAVLLLAEPR